MTNATGDQSLTTMADFDRLPRAVRAALAASDHNWAATVVLKELRARKNRRILNARHAVKLIVEWDRWKHRQDAGMGMLPSGQR